MRNILFLLIASLSFAVPAHAEKWVLTTLEWPPFTCEKCPDQGAGAKALRDALKSVGVELELVFVPWTRAIKEGADKKYTGYYPAWPEDVIPGFSPSPVIFSSEVGFIEPVGKPLGWTQLSDLKGKTIGVVQDYGNTKEFNEEAKKGTFKTESVTSDDLNVKKVAGGRIDGAFIDLANARWFLSKDLKDLTSKVKISEKNLGTKNLHVALNSHSSAKAAKISEALTKVDTNKIISEYLSAHLK